MSTEDDAFLVRARQNNRSNVKSTLFGLAMTRLVATDPFPRSGAISALAKEILAKQAQNTESTEEPTIDVLAVLEDETG